MKLLSVNADAKTSKGTGAGYLTGILYLAPADTSGVLNVCPKSSAGCRATCLNTAGRAGMFPAILEARKRKTVWLASDRAGFLAQLRADIASLVRKATRAGMVPCVRVNGTSDLPQIALEMAREFPTVQFYDYTKIPAPWKRTLPNYHLTFSLSEDNAGDAREAIAHGINVAVPFFVKRGAPLPRVFMGRPVIDGDLTDLRFLDTNVHAQANGVIVGLRAKGKAKKDVSGFVQIAGV